ncbi:MAG: hypothetical protein IJE69_03065 [Alistipes sp.]|nr:hypothetical protein [Alistipes sp.]
MKHSLSRFFLFIGAAFWLPLGNTFEARNPTFPNKFGSGVTRFKAFLRRLQKAENRISKLYATKKEENDIYNPSKSPFEKGDLVATDLA